MPGPTVPSPARVYDYYLGGKDNYASDRQAAEEIYTQIPDLPEIARDNRAFLQRAVRAFAETGIRQFIDVGTGLPTQGTSTRSPSRSMPHPGSSTSTTTQSSWRTHARC